MIVIEIDPPAFGPVRLGMTETEAKAALATALGEVKDSHREPGQPRAYYGLNEDLGIMLQVESVDHLHVGWIGAGAPWWPNEARITFRGVDMFQSRTAALRALQALGVTILTDDHQIEFLIQEFNLLMVVSGDPDLTAPFEAVVLANQDMLWDQRDGFHSYNHT